MMNINWLQPTPVSQDIRFNHLQLHEILHPQRTTHSIRQTTMADAPFQPYPQSSPPHDDTFHSTKRRKVIGQCPTCHQTFNSRHELREHMADPAHHAPASDSDAVSFGEL